MSDHDIEALVQAGVAAKMARWEAERAAERAREEEKKEADALAWRVALGPIALTCGLRPFLLDGILERAHEAFELRDGTLHPKPGILHPRDPCADLDPVTWLADLRTGPDGDLLFKR